MLNIKKDETFGVRLYFANKDQYDNVVYCHIGSAKSAYHDIYVDPNDIKNHYYCIHTLNGNVVYYSRLYGMLEYLRKNKYSKYEEALKIIEEEHIKEFLEP